MRPYLSTRGNLGRLKGLLHVLSTTMIPIRCLSLCISFRLLYSRMTKTLVRGFLFRHQKCPFNAEGNSTVGSTTSLMQREILSKGNDGWDKASSSGSLLAGQKPGLHRKK